MKITLAISLALLTTIASLAQDSSTIVTKSSGKYPIVDTGQIEFFNNTNEIQKPNKQSSFYGQDAQYTGNQPSYTDNGNGTITDNVTDLIWQKGYEVMSYDEAVRKVKNFKLAGKSDWRIPTIKEAYSLIQFSGVDLSPNQMQGYDGGSPFVDTRYFEFAYGSNGDRDIDVQILSSTIYKGTTMGGAETVFGVNLADGRIKGYPIFDPRKRAGKFFTVRFVRGNTEYGKNNFIDNGDGTISDKATRLMWQKGDSQEGMNWQEALEWVTQKNKENYLGYNNWRLPNVKELQSIVDYSRSPQETSSAAINPIFEISSIQDEGGNNNYPFFWSSTTHKNSRNAGAALYVSFGEALGYFYKPGSGMQGRIHKPPHGGRRTGPQGGGMRGGRLQDDTQGMMRGVSSEVGLRGEPQGGMHRVNGDNTTLLDVHGAGAQRSDPKVGDSSQFPQGRGPQGDVVRINNYVRMVR